MPRKTDQSNARYSPTSVDEAIAEAMRTDPAYRRERQRLAPFHEIAGTVIAARSALGVTQEALAKAVGSSSTAISRLESGRHQTNVRTLQKLSNALGVSFAIRPHDGIATSERGSLGRAVTSLLASKIADLAPEPIAIDRMHVEAVGDGRYLVSVEVMQPGSRRTNLTPSNAGQPWQDSEVSVLRTLLAARTPIHAIAERLDRSPRAVEAKAAAARIPVSRAPLNLAEGRGAS